MLQDILYARLVGARFTNGRKKVQQAESFSSLFRFDETRRGSAGDDYEDRPRNTDFNHPIGAANVSTIAVRGIHHRLYANRRRCRYDRERERNRDTG